MHSLLHHTKLACRLGGGGGGGGEGEGGGGGGGAENKICLEASNHNEVWLTPSRGAGRVLGSISPCSTRN